VPQPTPCLFLSFFVVADAHCCAAALCKGENGLIGLLFDGVVRLYGWTENKREVEMDMREMVDKVKKGEPLYGHSELTPYMQGVAARNSRYSALLGHVLPWMNFVNHNQVSLAR
jgi:C-terminal of NADH-ubiquinone oxidoreductase 21 kDa subunit